MHSALNSAELLVVSFICVVRNATTFQLASVNAFELVIAAALNRALPGDVFQAQLTLLRSFRAIC